MSHHAQPGATPPGTAHPGPPGAVPFGTAPVPPPLSPSDERVWAMVAHLSVPFFGFVGPLLVRLGFGQRSPWLRETVAEALNFSILYSIAVGVSAMLAVIMIGIVVLPLVGLAALITCVLAAMAAHRGEQYRYPVNLRIVR